MAGLKIAAHPLVVAVAMGLLGPGAVLEEGRETGGLLEKQCTPEDDVEPPSAEDFARVEDLWHEVRELV
jgi:hypothetical protein